jgi:CRP/FNR family transcriptional regulator
MAFARFDKYPFYSRLTEQGRALLAHHPVARVEGAKTLLRRGDDANGAYFVVEGALRVYYLTPEGREATLYRVEPGGTCLLALTATFNDEPYPAWVESAKEGVTFARVSSATFRQLFDAEPAFREFLFSSLSGRVFELMQALEEGSTSRVEQRLAKLLLKRADAAGVVPLDQATLASELGTAREVVSRGLQQLKHEGLVQTGRGRVVVTDRSALGARCVT